MMFLGMAATADASTEAPSKLDTLDTDFDKLVNKILNDETKTFLLNNVLKDISDKDKPNVIKRLLKAKANADLRKEIQELTFLLSHDKEALRIRMDTMRKEIDAEKADKANWIEIMTDENYFAVKLKEAEAKIEEANDAAVAKVKKANDEAYVNVKKANDAAEAKVEKVNDEADVKVKAAEAKVKEANDDAAKNERNWEACERKFNEANDRATLLLETQSDTIEDLEKKLKKEQDNVRRITEQAAKNESNWEACERKFNEANDQATLLVETQSATIEDLEGQNKELRDGLKECKRIQKELTPDLDAEGKYLDDLSQEFLEDCMQQMKAKEIVWEANKAQEIVNIVSKIRREEFAKCAAVQISKRKLTKELRSSRRAQRQLTNDLAVLKHEFDNYKESKNTFFNELTRIQKEEVRRLRQLSLSKQIDDDDEEDEALDEQPPPPSSSTVLTVYQPQSLQTRLFLSTGLTPEDYQLMIMFLGQANQERTEIQNGSAETNNAFSSISQAFDAVRNLRERVTSQIMTPETRSILLNASAVFLAGGILTAASPALVAFMQTFGGAEGVQTDAFEQVQWVRDQCDYTGNTAATSAMNQTLQEFMDALQWNVRNVGRPIAEAVNEAREGFAYTEDDKFAIASDTTMDASDIDEENYGPLYTATGVLMTAARGSLGFLINKSQFEIGATHDQNQLSVSIMRYRKKMAITYKEKRELVEYFRKHFRKLHRKSLK